MSRFFTRRRACVLGWACPRPRLGRVFVGFRHAVRATATDVRPLTGRAGARGYPIETCSKFRITWRAHAHTARARHFITAQFLHFDTKYFFCEILTAAPLYRLRLRRISNRTTPRALLCAPLLRAFHKRHILCNWVRWGSCCALRRSVVRDGLRHAPRLARPRSVVPRAHADLGRNATRRKPSRVLSPSVGL